MLFYFAKGHWRAISPNPKGWIDRLRELCVECMKMGQCATGDAVKGQSASWPVPVCWSGQRGQVWQCSPYCARPCIGHQHNADSKTCHCVQGGGRSAFLSCWSLCMLLLYKLNTCSPPLPPPSNSVQSGPLCITPVQGAQTCLGDQDMVAFLLGWLFSQTERALCVPCFGPVSAHGHLIGMTDEKQKNTNISIHIHLNYIYW